MKAIKYILSAVLVMVMVWSCTQDSDNFDFVSTAKAPANISALYGITQDNTGLVTISPNGEGVTKFEVYFGDGTTTPANVKPGGNVQHIYAEGSYKVRIVGYGITGLKSEVTQDLIVSFKAPQNLVVAIANDLAISKKVNVTANAEFATFFDVYFGETTNETPTSANIGGTASHVYQNVGTYTIRVVAKGGAIATTEYSEDFLVTAILQPIASAPTPPARNAADVISFYGSAYTNVAGVNFNPDWGQSGQGSGFAEFDLNGDKMLQYIKLSYQGIDFGQQVDASGMEYLHFDVWTADAEKIETSLINGVNGVSTEKPVVRDLVSGQWNSFDIPVSEWVNQGLSVNQLFQFKFVGTPWATGTVFIDNLYFYKTPSAISKQMIQDFEGPAPTFTVFGNIAPTTVVANPDASGVNTSANVAKFTKTAGSEVWAGNFFEVSSPLALSSYNKISVKTWSPKVGAIVKLKLENQDASKTYEVDVKTTKSGQWEDLLYDFSNAPVANYVRIVLFFDFGNSGDDAVYYYDDIQLVNDAGVPTGGIYDPIDFESTGKGADWTWTVFENVTNPPVEFVANPDKSGINTSSTVAKITALQAGQPWVGCESKHGADLGTFTLDATNKIVKIMVYKTVISDVGIKFATASGAALPEIKVANTKINQWEQLTFDFSGYIGKPETINIDQIIIFPDFNMSGRTSDTVTYFDNITFGN